jgi:hypothetical protein
MKNTMTYRSTTVAVTNEHNTFEQYDLCSLKNRKDILQT